MLLAIIQGRVFMSHSHSRISIPIPSLDHVIVQATMCLLYCFDVGLIIDAFGELRDKEESLTAEMQNKCLSVDCQRTNLTTYLTALITTPPSNTTWLTTCEERGRVGGWRERERERERRRCMIITSYSIVASLPIKQVFPALLDQKEGIRVLWPGK